MGMTHPLRWVAALGATGAVVLAAWWAMPAAPEAPVVVLPGTTTPGTVAQGWSLLALGGGDSPSQRVTTSSAPTLPAPEDLWQALFVDGSLRGSELDGSWGDWDGQQLAPSHALRRRFDQLLTTLGETTPEALRTLVAWLAERDLGAAGAEAVLAVWDRYLKLQHHRFKETMDLTRPERWPYVLQDHQLARRDALGIAWADAFFREEEAAFRQRIDTGPAHRSEGQPNWTAAAPQGVSAEAWQRQRVDALGEEAADRLQAEERAQAEWNQRLADARLSIERLAGAPELSAVQRQEAAQSWLNEHFQGTDRLRASALLGL
jgi:lipase chaperone LimK